MPRTATRGQNIGGIKMAEVHYDVENGKGAFEILASEIEGLLPAEGGWWINGNNGFSVHHVNELVIHTAVSRDWRRNRNGGEYDYYTRFAVVGDGILVYKDTSCELRMHGMGRDEGYVIPCIVSLEGLRRIAALVGLRAACKQFLKRGIGYTELKEAVKLAE